MSGAVIGGVLLGSIAGWLLAGAVKERNPYGLVVGLVYLGMAWFLLLVRAQ